MYPQPNYHEFHNLTEWIEVEAKKTSLVEKRESRCIYEQLSESRRAVSGGEAYDECGTLTQYFGYSGYCAYRGQSVPCEIDITNFGAN